MNNAFSMNNITKRYKNFTLDNITLSLPTGCVMGLVGENGAGKTTLLKILYGAIRSEGELSLLGETDVNKIWEVRQKIGIVPDEVNYPLSFKLKEIDGMMNKCFDKWDSNMFFEYADRFEISENTKFKDYSFGMKKKIAISAALSHNADLLILDEATSGLDPVVRDEFAEIIFEFTRDENHSVLFSSHIVTDLEKLCDYIAILHKGRLIMCEEKDVLLDSYRKISCTEEELKIYDRRDILGRRATPYGVQAIVRTDAVKNNHNAEPTTIEDIFVQMIKGEEK